MAINFNSLYPPFEQGDVVALRSFGQLMTVEDYCPDCDVVSVVWFGGNERDGWTGPHYDAFDASMLVSLEDA